MAMEEMGGMSIADAMALKNSDGIFGNGSGAWVFFLFFILAWGGGGFWGNNQRNAATTEDVQNQFNFAALERQNNEIVDAVRQASYDVTGVVKDVGYTNLNGIRDVESQIAQIGYQQSSCCCETNRNIDSVRYDAAMNTAAITNAIHAEGESTRALINSNTMQNLRDQLADAKLANSQCAQNAYLVSQLQPVAKPAYLTASPYAQMNYGFYGNYGYGGCNGCGGFAN